MPWVKSGMIATMSDQVPASVDRKRAGALGCAVFLAIAVLGVITILRGCTGPGSRGRRLMTTDPCGAAVLLAQDVRQDWKGSMASLMELAKIDKPCALRQLIDLMDLPNGRDINNNLRRYIWQDVQRRTAEMNSSTPPYDPSEAQDVRTRQKMAWIAWYDATFR